MLLFQKSVKRFKVYWRKGLKRLQPMSGKKPWDFSKNHPPGFSLIEVLVTLSLLSLTVIILMNFQLRLLKNLQHMQLCHIALNDQISLFEELRSCFGNTQAENEVLQKWQKRLDKGLSNARIEISRKPIGYRSVFFNEKNQQIITLHSSL